MNKIKKIDMNGYNAYFLKTKKYSTIHMSYIFEMEYTKEDIYLCDVLAEYLLKTNEIYKTREQIHDKSMECYNTALGIKNICITDNLFVKFDFVMYDPSLVKDDFFDSALEFMHDMMFKPNFIDGKLDQEVLKVIKDNMIVKKANSLANPQYKARNNFYNTILPNTYVTRDTITTKEEYADLINSYTDKDIIDMYYKIIDSSLVSAAFMGNLSEEYLQKIASKFKFKNTRELEKNYFKNLTVQCDKDFVKETDSETNESILYIAYDFKDYDYKTMRYVYSMINELLGYGGRVIHKVLRDELGLVYSATGGCDAVTGGLVMKAFINRENCDKAVEGFGEVLRRISDIKFVEELLPKIKANINSDYLTRDENKYNILDEVIDKVYEINDSPEKRLEAKNKVTAEDIVNVVKKFEKKTVYLYEGVKK